MNDTILNGLNETIKNAMTELNVPGAQVAIVKDGEVIYSEAFGYANLDKKILMTKEHILPIGSSSKSFTATAAVMLANDGKLDLDEPIRTYMPEFKLYDSIATYQATPRDLLCHRTGIPRHDLMWFNWNDLERKDLALNRISHLKNSIPFRSGWQYQNQMFAMIGYLIEKISGKTWEEFVEEKIFEPLGIKEYSFQIPYPDNSGKYARLYTPNKDGVNEENEPLVIDALGPAGSINTTIDELAKWIIFNLNIGKVGEKSLIEENQFKELYKPNIPYQILPFEFQERTTVGYGLGWTIDSFRGHKVVDHGGNVNGGSALISFMPDDSIGCAILTNANSNLFGDALSMEIYDRYLGYEGEKNWFTEYQDGMNALLSAMKGQLYAIYDTKIEDKPYSHKLEEYAGEYTNSGYGDISITVKGNVLHMQYHNNSMEVKHLHYDIFTFELFGGPHSISFATGVDGSISSLSIPFEPSVEPILFTKK
ncbi:serine hydrolase [Sporosalibacterium faouarense]|uniref:serine hydrolase n=1 Tax=Sporosalibacterium faouarense TaxID=516123 RepID=UPI00192B119F|nr:serine hydrolase [Sporosalibacterium faouarense]